MRISDTPPPTSFASSGLPTRGQNYRAKPSNVAFKSFEAIARRNGKIAEVIRIIKLNELAAGNLGETGRKTLGNATFIQNHPRQIALE